MTDESKLQKFLKRIEWDTWGYDRYGDSIAICPDCGNYEEEGHLETCELNAILKLMSEGDSNANT